MRVYLDSNVFIAAIETQGLVRDLLVRLLTLESRRLPAPLVTSELSRAEALVAPFRSGGSLVQTYIRLIRSTHVLETIPVVSFVLTDAALLRAVYPSLKLPDAIHVATAIGTGCDILLSNDGRLRTIESSPPEERLRHPYWLPDRIDRLGRIKVVPLEPARLTLLVTELENA